MSKKHGSTSSKSSRKFSATAPLGSAGTIVNVSSIGGIAAFPSVGFYNATKFAVEALSDLPEAYDEAVRQENLRPAERYLAFLSVLEKDARDSLVTIQLVLAQPISTRWSVIVSQLPDAAVGVDVGVVTYE